MGSSSSRLDTEEQFRPWVESGLEYLFLPDGAKAQIEANQQQDFSQATPQRTISPAQGHSLNQRNQSQPPVQRSAQQPARPLGRQQKPVNQQPPQQMPRSARSTGNVHFPPPWDTYLSKVKVTEPKVVCTYMELGLDLGGQADKKRGSVLRNTLNHHLKWPPGTAAFWPMAGLVNGSLQPNADLFWRGWQMWKSPYIVCFGEDALRVIYPDAVPGQKTIMLEHVAIHVTLPLSTLTTMLPHDQQLSTESLLTIRI